MKRYSISLGRDGSRVVRNGPFTWHRYGAAGTYRTLQRGHVLIFCIEGRAELCFRSFRFTLTPSLMAVADTRALVSLHCQAGTELVEYRPGARRMPLYPYPAADSAFQTFPVRAELREWVAAKASRIRSGYRFDRHGFCPVAVQLRDRSGGTIPYPYACAEGCPLWRNCTGTDGPLPEKPGMGLDAAVSFASRPRNETAAAACAAAVGILIWGSLLLYGLWESLRRLAEQ